MLQIKQDAAILREQKKLLRRDMLDTRKSFPAEERIRAGTIMREKALHLSALDAASVVMLYASTAEEIDLFPMMEILLQRGKSIALPHIIQKGQMEALSLTSLEHLVEGPFGIMMPDPMREDIVSPQQIDVIIVPGAAFSADGRRLGLGGGYYDRFLAKTVQAFRLVLAYDWQVVPDVPAAPHDAYVDAILTERRMIYCCGAGSRSMKKRCEDC